MKKVLFLIHDLCGGGAEKILVNTVNHLDRKKFEVHVISLFGGGVNEKSLASHIHYKSIFKKSFPGNSKIVKILSPVLLHKLIIKENYDIEVAFLEGSISKIISGCTDSNTKTVSWIHTDQRNYKGAIGYFRNEEEAKRCYEQFDSIVCVSETVKNRFRKNFPTTKNPIVLYNVLETDKIKALSVIKPDMAFTKTEINIVTIGKIAKSKGVDRLARITVHLREAGYLVHTYAIGTGKDKKEIEDYIAANNAQDFFTFLNYQTNPYQFLARCDLYVCASLQEGFSTAATEAIILGIPVCTVEVSGMKELLGSNNEWGVITDNDEEALYNGIENLISDPEKLQYYKKQAESRSKDFSTEKTIGEVERFLLSL